MLLPDGVLSSEPQNQAIELAFLERLIAVSQARGAEVLARSNAKDVDSFQEHKSLMQSKFFERAARELEQSVEIDATFGRFRGNKPG